MKTQCPKCSKIFDVPNEYAGRTVKCLGCKKEMIATPCKAQTNIQTSLPLKKNTKRLPKTEQAACLIGPAICPYCSALLEKRPKRSRKCPTCQCKIILREGRLLTEKQAAEYDKRVFENMKSTIARNRMSTLRSYAESRVVKYVEIISAGQNSCSVCRGLDGKRFLLKNELSNPTLPVKKCISNYGYCRCCYVPVVD